MLSVINNNTKHYTFFISNYGFFFKFWTHFGVTIDYRIVYIINGITNNENRGANYYKNYVILGYRIKTNFLQKHNTYLPHKI